MHDSIILEIFAGTGCVTACFKSQGFSNSVAVDKVKSAGALTNIIPLDLTKEEDQQAVFHWIRHPAVRGVFVAPPCGTASAARNIDLPGEDPPRPKPLRSLEQPDGISGLKGVDLVRVSAANVLYSFSAEVLELCCSLGKLFMLENPRNSLFWLTTRWKESSCAGELYFCDHQACAYGAKRPKWTRLAANFPHVGTINGQCPGNHQHEPWGIIKQGASKRIFATSLEVHYPPSLCKAIVHAFILCLTERGLQFTEVPKLQHAARAATAEQSKSPKLKPLVSPFSNKLVAFYNHSQQVWPTEALPMQACKLFHEISLGDVVGAKQFSSGSWRSRLETELSVWGVDLCLESFANCEIFLDSAKVFGVQRGPCDFLDKACCLQHPLNPALALPEVLDAVIKFTTTEGFAAVAKSRVEFFRKWHARAKELEQHELEIRSRMDEHVNKAVEGKRLALFADMLAFYEYPDLQVIEELTEGASLTGDVPETGMLPFKFSPAVLTTDTLKVHSSLRRQHLFAQSTGSGDAEVDAEVWRQTIEERDRGWLKGPLKLEEVPEEAPISRRFGLKQRHNVRLIDDFSESSVNSTVTVFETPVLHTVDVACAVLMLDAMVYLCKRDFYRAHTPVEDIRPLQCISTSGAQQVWQRSCVHQGLQS